MDELIQRLTSQLGLDQSVAEAATAKTMAVVKQQVGDDLFAQISSAVPGASAAVESQEASPEPATGGGMFGKLASMASDAIGGDAGGGLEIGAALASTGVETDKLGGFVSTVMTFLREKAGDTVIDQVMQKFPMLKSLMG